MRVVFSCLDQNEYESRFKHCFRSLCSYQILATHDMTPLLLIILYVTYSCLVFRIEKLGKSGLL